MKDCAIPIRLAHFCCFFCFFAMQKVLAHVSQAG